jgi:ion channel
VASLRRLGDDVKSGESYATVLALLLASLVVWIVAPEATWARIVRDVVLSVTIVVAFWTATRGRPFLVPGVLLPSAALVFVLIGALEGARTHAVTAAIGTMLVGIVAYLVTRDLVRRGTVTAQTVFGALSLYVLLGMLFGLLYQFIADVTDAAFFGRGDGTSGEHVYYSFVAISTTGFGDLAPATGIGRALTVLEILLGELYLVTVVAVLVTTAAGRTRRPVGGVDSTDDRHDPA